MKKVVALLTLVSLAASYVEADFSPDDKTKSARLEAELKAAEQQHSQAQQKIAQLREELSRHESDSHVRSTKREQKSYKGGMSEADMME